MKVLENSTYSAKEAAAILAERTGSDCVQAIGSKFVLYLQKTKGFANTPICCNESGRAIDARSCILFGGTFDPPHERPHGAAGQRASKRCGRTLCWWSRRVRRPVSAPAAHPPPTVFAMCRSSARCFRSWCWIPHGDHRQRQKLSIDTVRQMNTQYPGALFHGQRYAATGSATGQQGAAAPRIVLWRTCARARTRLRCREYAARASGRGRQACMPQSARVSRVLHRGARAGGKGQAVGRPCARKRGGVRPAHLYRRGRGGLASSARLQDVEAHASAGPLRARSRGDLISFPWTRRKKRAAKESLQSGMSAPRCPSWP